MLSSSHYSITTICTVSVINIITIPHLYKLHPLIISRLSVLLDYNKAYAIDITALLDVLQNIQHYEAEIPDSERSIKGTPVQDFTDGTSGPPSWVCILNMYTL